jgi:hypothetical protein
LPPRDLDSGAKWGALNSEGKESCPADGLSPVLNLDGQLRSRGIRWLGRRGGRSRGKIGHDLKLKTG